MRCPMPSRERPLLNRPREQTCSCSTERRYRARRTRSTRSAAWLALHRCSSFRIRRQRRFAVTQHPLCRIGSLEQDFGTLRTPISVRVSCIEVEFPSHSNPVACQEVQCDVFIICAAELLHDEVARSRKRPLPGRGKGRSFRGCTCQQGSETS